MQTPSKFFSQLFGSAKRVAKTEGLILGIKTFVRKPLSLDNAAATRNLLILGQAGSGKTTFARGLLEQQTWRGGGWLFIDPYPTQETRDLLAHQAKSAGRDKDFFVLDVTNPENSNTYNPLVNGDADTIAQRLLALLPGTDNDPGADFYRQAAARALTLIITALKAAHRPFTFEDLAELLTSPQALNKLKGSLPYECAAYLQLEEYLEQFATQTKFERKIDPYKLKAMLGGMSGRIAQFTQGKFGSTINAKVPHIDFADIIKNNKMCYVMLPTIQKGDAAAQLGKMILADFRSTAAQLANNPEHKGNAPFALFADQISSYWATETTSLLRLSRNINVAVITALQSIEDLKALPETDCTTLLENTHTKLFLPSRYPEEMLQKMLEGFSTLEQPQRQIPISDLQRLKLGHGYVLAGATGHRVKLFAPSLFSAPAFLLKKTEKTAIEREPWLRTVPRPRPDSIEQPPKSVSLNLTEMDSLCELTQSEEDRKADETHSEYARLAFNSPPAPLKFMKKKRFL